MQNTTQPNQQQMDDREHGELLALWPTSIEDIERSKQWQWTITYHTILAEAALLGLSTIDKFHATTGRTLFVLMTVVTAVFGSLWAARCQKTLMSARERVNKLKDAFGPKFKDVVTTSTSERKPSFPAVPMIWIVTVLITLTMLIT